MLGGSKFMPRQEGGNSNRFSASLPGVTRYISTLGPNYADLASRNLFFLGLILEDTEVTKSGEIQHSLQQAALTDLGIPAGNARVVAAAGLRESLFAARLGGELFVTATEAHAHFVAAKANQDADTVVAGSAACAHA